MEQSVPTKVCSKCDIPKSLTEFAKRKVNRSGLDARCRECKNINSRKTPNGFLHASYRGMRRRVLGKHSKASARALYTGLPILDKSDFFTWAKSSADFWRLYRQWVQAGYSRKLSPSVNRIDPTKGYVLSNMEWLSHSLNSGLARRHTDGAFQRIYASLAA